MRKLSASDPSEACGSASERAAYSRNSARSFCAVTAEATTYAAFNLHQRVEFSDVIVLGTVIDSQRGIVRVDEALKGSTEKSIQLVDHVFHHLRHRFRTKAWRLMESESMHASLLQWVEQRGFSPALRTFAWRGVFLESTAM